VSNTKDIITTYLDQYSKKDMLFLKSVTNQSEQVTIIKGGKEWRLKTSKYKLLNWLYRKFNVYHWHQLSNKVKVRYMPISNQDSQ
jgi:hypothetical protein